MSVYTIVGADEIPLPRGPVIVTAPGSQILCLARVARLGHWCIVDPISWTHHLARGCDQDSASCPIFVVLTAEEGTSIDNVPA